MAQQTAVEWLVKKMNVLDNDSTIPISVTATKEIWNDIFEKAKAMEKEQIVNAHFEGWSDAYEYLKDDISAPRQAIDYYNETYTKKNIK